jgi:DNA-binding FadR family transcriptional regulator
LFLCHDARMAESATRFRSTRLSRAEELAREIEREIVDDSLVAGHRLGTKEDLRQRFGVAIATVNEALRVLETRGIVEARPGPGGGVFVATVSSRVRLNHLVLGFKVGDSPFSDCLAVRNALEPLVCQEASRSCRARDAGALRQVIDRMEHELDDPTAFLKLNWELHRRMAKLCANAPLKSLYLTLLDYVEDGLADVRSDDVFDGVDNLTVHTELVEAIIAGEPGRLAAAIEAHMPIADRWSGSDDG